MKLSLAILVCLLPYLTIGAIYNEASQRKVKLEDIEDEHLQSERRSKAIAQPPSLPPPLSKQPAKGQPTKLVYPPVKTDRVQEENPSETHRYSTRAEHHVQPLTDQPIAPEADYQQSPAFRHETIVYYPNNAGSQRQQYDIVQQQQQQQQQLSPVFYYNHDIQQPTEHGYQVQFVPIGRDEQQTDAGHGHSQQAAAVPPVSYSHDAVFGSAQAAQGPPQQQQVYGLPSGNLLYESQKDIEYAKPAGEYGPPPRSQIPFSSRQKDVEYAQPEVEYTSPDESQASAYVGQQKDIEYAQQNEVEIAQKPDITYGPPDTVGQTPHIEYGVPDAPFRRPGQAQSNQNAYAPRRPDSSARADDKPFAISFPYPPSFVSITTRRPFYEKSAPEPETSYNQVPQWQTNVMPLSLIPPSQDAQYRSFGHAQGPIEATGDVQHIEFQQAPLVDIFHSRHSKSLLDSYVPSWLVARMQEEQARQLHQQQQHQHQQHQQSYAIPSPASEAGYNTIAYSTQFENIYGRNLKRSIQRSRAIDKKKTTLNNTA